MPGGREGTVVLAVGLGALALYAIARSRQEDAKDGSTGSGEGSLYDQLFGTPGAGGAGGGGFGSSPAGDASLTPAGGEATVYDQAAPPPGPDAGPGAPDAATSSAPAGTAATGRPLFPRAEDFFTRNIGTTFGVGSIVGIGGAVAALLRRRQRPPERKLEERERGPVTFTPVPSPSATPEALRAARLQAVRSVGVSLAGFAGAGVAAPLVRVVGGLAEGATGIGSRLLAGVAAGAGLAGPAAAEAPASAPGPRQARGVSSRVSSPPPNVVDRRQARLAGVPASRPSAPLARVAAPPAAIVARKTTPAPAPMPRPAPTRPARVVAPPPSAVARKESRFR